MISPLQLPLPVTVTTSATKTHDQLSVTDANPILTTTWVLRFLNKKGKRKKGGSNLNDNRGFTLCLPKRVFSAKSCKKKNIVPEMLGVEIKPLFFSSAGTCVKKSLPTPKKRASNFSPPLQARWERQTRNIHWVSRTPQFTGWPVVVIFLMDPLIGLWMDRGKNGSPGYPSWISRDLKSLGVKGDPKRTLQIQKPLLFLEGPSWFLDFLYIYHC